MQRQRKCLVCVLMLLCNYVFARDTATTTKTYELQVPGSSSIKIIEADPLWGDPPTTQRYNSEFEHRAFGGGFQKDEYDHGSSEVSTGALQQFLKSYADKIKNRKPATEADVIKPIDSPLDDSNRRVFAEDDDSSEEKSKSWDTLNVRRHNHPYDDKKGWVTLEAVPWSISKVSKWHSSNRNQNNQRPWEDDYDSQNAHRPFYGNYQQRPSDNYYSKPSHHYNYNNDEDDYYKRRPDFERPSAVYAQKVYVQHGQESLDDFPQSSWNKKHGSQFDNRDYYHKHNENCDHSGEIITDGLPPNFPQTYPLMNRRRGSASIQADSHPFGGDGDWVLLSTTRGYKYPKNRERALQIGTDSVGAHRTVRLTVLPPLKNSKVNMTTSHGGLLQVESTFQTVEQAQKAFVKKQKQKTKMTTKRPQRINYKKPQIQQSTVQNTFSTRKDAADGSAVLAAVGAGMIPATMAMLVPMAMGGRKRRDLNQYTTAEPNNIGIEITLPRSL